MKEIKIVRIILFVGIVTGFSWLHWWVLPTLGMFRVLPNDPPIPHTGASLVFFMDGKAKSAYALSGVTLGWPLAWTTWPLALICILFGFGLGHFNGEFFRRKFVVEILPEKTRQKLNEVFLAACYRESSAEYMLKKANALYFDANLMKDAIFKERRKLRIMHQAAEEQMQNCEKLRHKAEYLEKELTKASAKIRQLQKKVGRQSEEFD